MHVVLKCSEFANNFSGLGGVGGTVVFYLHCALISLFYASRYLHEVCQPPVVHRNFKSGNVLLDEDLDVRVSDCGLAPLISSGAVSQVSHDPGAI